MDSIQAQRRLSDLPSSSAFPSKFPATAGLGIRCSPLPLQFKNPKSIILNRKSLHFPSDLRPLTPDFLLASRVSLHLRFLL